MLKEQAGSWEGSMRSMWRGCAAAAAASRIALSAAAQPAPNPLLSVIVEPTPPPDEVDNLPPWQNPIDFFDTYSWRIFIALNWPAAQGQRGVPDGAKSISD